MKRFAHPFAILALAAACTAFNASAGAQQFEIQVGTSELQNAENAPSTAELKEKKQLRAVRHAYEVKRAFDLAAKERGRQAIEISCSPAVPTGAPRISSRPATMPRAA